MDAVLSFATSTIPPTVAAARRTDAQLLAEVPRRPEAIGELYARWAGPVLRHVARRTDDHALALEVVAETFAQALLHAARFRDPGDGSAGPWLFGIASNLLHRAWRSNAVDSRARRRLGMRERLEADDHAEDAAERLTAAGRAPALAAALAALPDAQREAVTLRVVEGLEYAEIADALGIATATARVRVFRGLKALRAALETDEEETTR
ncbi:RNA polymerase sigma factor [Baekduia sp.]|uniref:RNA polymerase sigma factor n=1 Tax=Baekduia sp. TaxID=2600305 RepID=UPI002D791C4A|nr:sigma-70 family RNA polymerase sigma factor [Baekduia sp.]